MLPSWHSFIRLRFVETWHLSSTVKAQIDPQKRSTQHQLLRYIASSIFIASTPVSPPATYSGTQRYSSLQMPLYEAQVAPCSPDNGDSYVPWTATQTYTRVIP